MGLRTKEMQWAESDMDEAKLNHEIYCAQLRQPRKKTRLLEIYIQLQQMVIELRPFVEKEVNEINRRAARRERQKLN